MKKLFRAKLGYSLFGLAMGIFFREFTKLNDFT